VPQHDPALIAEVLPGLTALRSRGFRLSFHYSVVAPLYKSWQPLSNFVKVDMSTVPEPQVGALLSAIHARTPATVIAAKVERAEQFAQLKAQGVDRFQGFWFSVPEVVTPRVLSPGEVCAVQLFNLLRNEADLNAVEEVLKKDAGLSVSLLRIINSAGVGLNQKVTSLRQAVMLMGYDKLARWAAMLLATASSGSTGLLSTSSVVRARMMELLALEQPDALDAGTAFLIGLLSQLDRLLGTSMLNALNQLALDEEVKSALLNGGGTYGNLLALVVACESEDDAGFATAYARFNYTLRQVNMAHMEALAWADGMA
jgi:EAL and modified HD-GYP domain-containing signal transduction protein